MTSLLDPDGLHVDVAAYGARITAIRVPTPQGWRRQVVVSDPRGEHFPGAFAGATVGRFANRIADARFVLDGREHLLHPVDRGNALHSGPDGFDTRVWTLVDAGRRHVELALDSPDGDQGFPGALSVRARFEVDGLELRTSYVASTDAPTHVNISSHSYFDLDGDGAADQRLTVRAAAVLPVDGTGIPTGEQLPVAGTTYDLTSPRRVGDLDLDHCYVLEGAGLRPVATLEGRDLRLDVLTDQPGLQVFTGGGVVPGVALEPQHFPDSPHRPSWPSTVLRPGETYAWHSVLRFHA